MHLWWTNAPFVRPGPDGSAFAKRFPGSDPTPYADGIAATLASLGVSGHA